MNLFIENNSEIKRCLIVTMISPIITHQQNKGRCSMITISSLGRKRIEKYIQLLSIILNILYDNQIS
jgi:hypothetical protein